MDYNLDRRHSKVSKGHGASCLRRKEDREKEEEEEGKRRKEGRSGDEFREEQENLHIWLLCIWRLTCLRVIYNVYEAEDGPLR